MLEERPGSHTIRLQDAGPVRLLVSPLVRAGRRVGVFTIGEPIDAVRRAQQGLADLLAPRVLELSGFLADQLAVLAPLADRRLELGAVITGELTADPDRLAQVLRNLLGNAIEPPSREASFAWVPSQGSRRRRWRSPSRTTAHRSPTPIPSRCRPLPSH